MPPTAPTARLCATCSSIVAHTEFNVSEIYHNFPSSFKDDPAIQAFRGYKSEIGFKDAFAKERLTFLFTLKEFRNSPFTSTFGDLTKADAEKRTRYNNIIDTMVIESIFDSLKDYKVTKMLTLDYMDNNQDVLDNASIIMGLFGPAHKDIMQYIESEFEKASKNMKIGLIKELKNDQNTRKQARKMIKRVGTKVLEMQDAKIIAAQRAEETAAGGGTAAGGTATNHGAKNKQDSKPKKGVKMRGTVRKRRKSRTREEERTENPQMRREAWGPTPPPEKPYNSNKPLSDAKQNNPQTRRIRRSRSTHAKFYDNDETNF